MLWNFNFPFCKLIRGNLDNIGNILNIETLLNFYLFKGKFWNQLVNQLMSLWSDTAINLQIVLILKLLHDFFRVPIKYFIFVNVIAKIIKVPL